MKLALLAAAWIALAALAALATGSCSIDHRSGDLACTVNADCEGGRRCVEGYCVFNGIDARLPDGGPRPDASPDAPKPGDCPAACTTCDGPDKQCLIDCASGDCPSNVEVACPSGWNCTVLCNTPGSCNSGVSCLNAASCDVQCIAAGSCRGVKCGPGRCDVLCSGQDSCRNVVCGESCACEVECRLGARCEAVTCSGEPQCEIGPGCQASNTGCDTCP